ncbi:MAG: matrixin family metalloprotease [Flavobacterium sp.]|nr:matrixin family metalloprotease [Flavobacterium sp.]
MFSGKTKDIPAKTRVFYNRKGFITEADIVLNPYQQFSTDGSFGTFDLESVITHELGHLLGLDHSTVIGSTMLSHIGKNGVYSMANFTAQTLSDDDIAGVRSIYKTEESNCCGTINGKILLRNGKNASNFHIWAEESETGKISAGVLTKSDGTFQIDGLSKGKYRLFAQDKNIIAKFSAEEIGEITLEKEKTIKVEHKLSNALKNFSLKYIGFNSQLTKQAIPVNEGKSFTIYVGAEKINAEDILIRFNSPFFSVLPNSFVKHDFGNDFNVLSFEVMVSSKAVFGDYSLQIYNKNQETDYFVGSLTIDKFTNIWENKMWLNEE